MFKQGPVRHHSKPVKKSGGKSNIAQSPRIDGEAVPGKIDIASTFQYFFTGTKAMERRLAAILVADIVGYSRLTEADEVGTVKRMNYCRSNLIDPAIVKSNGRIFKSTGDGFLAEFSSVVDALECATFLQKAIRQQEADRPQNRRLEYRMGINLGDVIIEGNDILGDGVNVAARLETLADPGGICVSEFVRGAVGEKLPYGYEFMGEKSVKNISKPVRVYRVLLDPGASLQKHYQRKIFRKAWLSGAAAAGVAALILTGIFLSKETQQPAKDARSTSSSDEAADVSSRATAAREGQSIAVLPFSNKSDEKDQRFFADGITDDIITELTKVPGLLVIARESTFNYRDAIASIREVARTLKARYILQGSVRRSDDRVRINVALFDSTTELLVWGDRYDGKLDNVFDLQDQIAEKIVASLSLTLSPADEQHLRRVETTDLVAYENFLKGRDQFLRFSRNDTFDSRAYLNKALERDPKFARAYAMLAWTYTFEYTNGWSDNTEQTLTRAFQLAEKAISLNERLPIAYFVKGVVHRERHEYIEATAESQKSIEIDPSYANGYVLLATVLYYAGRPEEGLQMINKAERINPLHPSNYPFHKGQALFILQRYEEAAVAFTRGLKKNPTSQRLRVWLAATYAQLGRQEDAEWQAGQILLNDPDFKLSRLSQVFPFKNPNDLARFNGALQKVGFDKRW